MQKRNIKETLVTREIIERRKENRKEKGAKKSIGKSCKTVNRKGRRKK